MTVVRFPDLVISAGESVSNAIGGYLFDNLGSLNIFGPGTLAGTVKVQVSDEEPDDVSNWYDLQVGGSDVNPTADNTVLIETVAFRSLRLNSDTNAGAGGETYKVVATERLLS